MWGRHDDHYSWRGIIEKHTNTKVIGNLSRFLAIQFMPVGCG